MYGGIVFVIGCGEIVEYIEVFLSCWVILVKFEIGVFIVDVY